MLANLNSMMKIKAICVCMYRYRIGPFEVESALIEHPAVAESAVVSSPDETRGQVSSKISHCISGCLCAIVSYDAGSYEKNAYSRKCSAIEETDSGPRQL